MGVCWYCHWGWPAPVAAIYQEALARLDGNDSPLEFGPGHIVWSDENFEEAEWCLAHFEEWVKWSKNFNEEHGTDPYNEEELAVVKWSLEALAALPNEVRCVIPGAYIFDDMHPDRYPPPPGVVMTQKHQGFDRFLLGKFPR